MDLSLYQHDTERTARLKMPDATNRQMDLLNWALGLGEAGEVQNLIKKHVFHGHPMTAELRDAIIDELGDMLWYIARMSSNLEIDLSRVAKRNLDKLRARYPTGAFREEDSINRKA